MGNDIIVKGQITLSTQLDSYTINLSSGEYIFNTENNGTIKNAVSFTTNITVSRGNSPIKDFTIGTIVKPTGFSEVTVDNTSKSIKFAVNANTANLPDTGIIIIPVIINNEVFNRSFLWSKAKGGEKGIAGQDAYTINLSRKSFIISTDKEGKIHTDVTTSTVISALKGSTVITPVIGTLPTVNGCTLSKSGITLNIVFKIGTALADNGIIDIPVTVDGKKFNVSFAYAKAKTGATGAPGVDANMLDWVKDWNTNKTVIGANSVITPKIFAGVKNSNGTLTGVALGRFALTSINASGQISTETIDGIYGFKDGYRTFYVDNGGNAQLGRGNQFVRYNAVTGKVEFGSEVSLNWTSAISTAKTEVINAAKDDATTKADAARNEAIKTAATDATNKVKVATEAANAAQTKANDASSVAIAARDRLINWAKDSVISPNEKLSLRQEQKGLADEKIQIVADAAKYSVSSAAYVTAFTNYNVQLTNHSAASPENITISAAFTTTQTAYYTAKQAILNAIAAAAKKYAEDKAISAKNDAIAAAATDATNKVKVATDAASAAQTKANDASSVAIAARDRLNNWAKDSVISPNEKLALKQEQKGLADEKTQIVADAAKYSVNSTAYVTAFTNYNAQLTNHSAASPEIITISATFTTTQTAYYAAKQTVLNAIAAAAKKYAEDKAISARNDAIAAAATDATNKVNAVQVGVRNYIAKSAFNATSIAGILTVDGVAAVIDTATKFQGNNSIKITQTTATGVGANSVRAYFTARKQCNPASFSMWVKASAATNLRIRIGGLNAVDIPLTTGWKLVKLENKIPNSTVVVFGATTAGVVFHIACPMLVEGTKAADWTPAPEDIATDITAANNAASAAQTQANTANSVAIAARDRLVNWAKDTVISPNEKFALKQEIKSLADEKVQILADATKYSVVTTAYVTAYTNYNTQLTNHSAVSPENITISASFATTQAAYYQAKQTVLNNIALAAKKYADDKASNAKAAAISAAATDAAKKISEITLGGENLIPNGDFRYYATNNAIGWDNSLNGNYVASHWGSGYNGGVTNPKQGYHAHLNTIKFGYPVFEFINKNSQIGSTKRWMGIAVAVINSNMLIPGEKYTFSVDLMVDTTGATIHGGLYSTKVGATAFAFSSGSYVLSPTVLNKWQRLSYTFTVDPVIDVSKSALFYIYSHTGAEGTTWVKNASLQLGTKGSWVRSYSDIDTAVADAKKAGTDAKTVADAITKKASDEKWANKLTHIDANGIFTGTLSANVVNAIRINATQITAGTIDVARLNVAALKTQLITAGNIEALTLSVIRGKIGGWSIDADSIFRGTKGNTSGGFTAASGSITIGSNGLRGFKWRLDSTGTGALAGGNISWDAAGNVTFAASVSLNWTNAANTALSNAKSYADTKQTEAIKAAAGDATTKATNAKNDAIKAAAADATNKVNAIQFGGRNLFKNSGRWKTAGFNGGILSNGGGYTIDNTVTYNGMPTVATLVGTGLYHNWIKLDTNVEYTYSAMVLCNETVTGNGVTPLHYHAGLNNVHQSKITIIKYDTSVVANVWKRIYIVFKLTGDANTFRAFLYRGANGTTKYWVAYMKLERGNKPTDWTPAPEDMDYLGTYINSSGVYTGILTANQVNVTGIDASKITVGTLSADRIAANSISSAKLKADEIKANIINTAYINGLSCTFTKGKIGGWTINAGSLSNANIVLDNTNKRVVVFGANSSVASGSRVQLYWNSNTDWGFYASNTAGTPIAQLGYFNQISGWSIDVDAISRGTKNNASGTYTNANGAITIGSAGLRGFKWRFESTGAGAIAGGNISWDAAGNVSFGASVSLQWKNDIEVAKSVNYGYRFYKQIIIYGEANKYYPVIIKGGDQTVKREILVRRGYSELAPDTWNNTTHKGGLILLIKTNFGGWGGSNYSWDIYELAETYTTTFAGAEHLGNMMHFAVYLRGGGPGGAVYHIYSDQTLTSQSYSPVPNPAAPQICYNQEVYWKSGASELKAPLPRTRTAAVNEEIRRRRFIALAQERDTYLSTHPLTYIGSTGIYTGTLTANQVNAVSINADSIKAGTLSADRIAAGSITAAKLNVASVQASVVTAAVVNGLTCTFVRGKIGGWTIGTDNITAGTIGGVGTLPIQIRSVASGSGYWYSGAYRPLGISMTWHQSSNAGHIVFGQIAATGNSVKAGFMGIQMMSWDHVEYFCLSANYTKVGSKEVYNRIAGWAFDSDSIWRGTKLNSVGYTAGSGSITIGSNGIRGHKWRLESTGAGAIAGGNISWDAAGNVSFGASVTLNWTNAANSALSSAKLYADTKKAEAAADATAKANAAKELAMAMAFGRMLYRDPTFLKGNNGMGVYNNSANGTVTHTRTSDASAPNDNKIAIVIKNTGVSSPSCGGFYFGTPTSARRTLITRIVANIPVGRSITFHSNPWGNGATSKWLTPVAGTGDWTEYVLKVVCGTSGTFSSTNYFVITGAVGTPTNPVQWKVAYATVFDIHSTERYVTTIDANGIYTGTVKAGQILVDTALVVGGSTYNGSVSVRDAGNVVKVTLNRSGITAVGGSIGGWVISATQISKNSIVLGADGSITNSTRWRLNNDGSGQLATGNISWDAAGTLKLKNAIISNVTITGTIRNAFAKYDSSIWINVGGGPANTDQQVNAEKYDNVCVFGGYDSGGWGLPNPTLPWTVNQSGRRLCLIHYRYGSEYAYGVNTITAPSGKYFFEDGRQKTTLTMSRELVELIGYGDATNFYGWIVLNRKDMMTTSKYGSEMKWLAMGTVTVNASAVSTFKYKTYDGSTMSKPYRSAVGVYTVYLPWSLTADGYMVMMTGKYINTPIYATIKYQYASSFVVQTQDDASANDGSFNFIIVSTADFK